MKTMLYLTAIYAHVSVILLTIALAWEGWNFRRMNELWWALWLTSIIAALGCWYALAWGA